MPVLRADGSDFHYQLENPVTLPSVASNPPTNPDLMNAAIIYKDTSENETANELYYKRKHDRESVIITFNDTSPRSFGTDYRSFGWTAHIIPDVAEPTPGNHPYPSVPPHRNAFMRVISISQGTYQWRLYADAAFSGLSTLYLDMRANDDDQDFIQNVAMPKVPGESYWASAAYAEADFPFRVLSSRSERTRIRIRNADDTLSTSIIHLIPVDDVREALVDEDRLHSVYADILDLMQQHIENLPSGGAGPTYTELETLTADSLRMAYAATDTQADALIAAWDSGTYWGFWIEARRDYIRAGGSRRVHSRDVFYCRPALDNGVSHIICGTFDDTTTNSPYWMRLEVNRQDPQATVVMRFGAALRTGTEVKIWGLS